MIVSLIVFGPNKLPNIARSMGKGLGELRKLSDKVTVAMAEEQKKVKKDISDEINTKKSE